MVNGENSMVLSCGLALRGIPHAPGQPAWVLNGIHCCIGIAGRYNVANRENSRVLSCGLALRGIPHAPGQPAWVLNGIHCCIG